MKKLGRWILMPLSIIVVLILSASSDIDFASPHFFRNGLNTKKIDRHIEKLKNYSWFNELYESEEHRQSFFVNFKIRKYLESSLRVSRLIRNEKKARSIYSYVRRNGTPSNERTK